jgi:hypothetical protein
MNHRPVIGVADEDACHPQYFFPKKATLVVIGTRLRPASGLT